MAERSIDPMTYAERLGLAVASELDRAAQLADRGFYTEAGLRLGRTIEAALYSTAHILGIDLTNRTIKNLTSLNSSLRAIELQIIRKGGLDEVRQLANVAKNLSDAVAHLAVDESLRSGVLEEQPRPNEALFRELLGKIADRNVQRRLRANEALLRTTQIHRNAAAHAALDGSERELDEADYEDFVQGTHSFLSVLLDCIVSERARKVWEPSSY